MRARTPVSALARTVPLVLLFAGPPSAPAQSPRLTDDQIKKLMESAEKDVDRFVKAAGSKSQTIRLQGSDSEFSLADLRKTCRNMKARFRQDYAANPEVLACLRRARGIEDYLSAGGGLSGGEKEWPRLRGNLAQLARAYEIDWTGAPDAWSSRRMNDREAVKTIEGLSAYADAFEKSLESALSYLSGVNADDRKNAFESIDRLKSSAGNLKDAVEDGGDPSTGIGRMRTAAHAIENFLEKHELANAVGSTWAPLATVLSTIEAAF